jgi:hypothetical protein
MMIAKATQIKILKMAKKILSSKILAKKEVFQLTTVFQITSHRKTLI